MTLRLTDEEAEALRMQAEREGRSAHAVVRAAITEYIEQYAHRRRVAAAAGAVASRYADALRRLGEA
jgi:predicted DNA-binding protein